MRIFSLIAVLLFVSSLAAPARAGMAEDCVQERDPELSISGCTAVIRSGQYSGRDLAVAYNNRGNAYNNLGDYPPGDRGLGPGAAARPGKCPCLHQPRHCPVPFGAGRGFSR